MCASFIPFSDDCVPTAVMMKETVLESSPSRLGMSSVFSQPPEALPPFYFCSKLKITMLLRSSRLEGSSLTSTDNCNTVEMTPTDSSFITHPFLKVVTEVLCLHIRLFAHRLQPMHNSCHPPHQ
ncbi:hypothetical protein TNCV_2914311 [Trichonephila clavipes]|nr:hypothetical protein TNCV_2914311 [Trichonephila clavipes]